MDMARGSARVNQTPRHVIRTGRDSSTQGGTCIAVISTHVNYQVLLGRPTVSPSCGISGRSQVGKTRESTSQDEIRNAQKLDTAVDIKLPDDWYSESVFIKVIGRELSHISNDDLYLRCWMNFLSNVVQTEAPQFVIFGIPAFNTSNEFIILRTPATRFKMPMGRYHWSASDRVFGKATLVRMSAARSD